eukprot:2250539-Prymnesium_polylepis.1
MQLEARVRRGVELRQAFTSLAAVCSSRIATAAFSPCSMARRWMCAGSPVSSAWTACRAVVSSSPVVTCIGTCGGGGDGGGDGGGGEGGG